VVIAVGAVLVVAAVVAAVLLTRGSPDEHTASGATQSPSAPPLNVQTKVSRVFGQLRAPRRRSLEKHVDGLVKGYLLAAFVDGRSGTAAFPGFTPAARALAARDANVLTAGSTHTVVRRALAFVSVFADHHRAQGATVHLILSVAVDGRHPRQITGQLLLTPTTSGWRVFGYRMARGTGA
jgi:hypothetical protein